MCEENESNIRTIMKKPHTENILSMEAVGMGGEWRLEANNGLSAASMPPSCSPVKSSIQLLMITI